MKAVAGACAVLALPLGGRAKERAPRCRLEITVVRRECFADLQSRYLCDPEAGPCSRFRTGERIEVNPVSEAPPAGFCPRAWAAILASLERPGCQGARDGELIVCCPDGTRPVVFRIKEA